LEDYDDDQISDEFLLNLCAKYNKNSWAEYLINKGADVNCYDNSPLEWAVKNNNKELIDILLNSGADKRYLDKDWSRKQIEKKLKKMNGRWSARLWRTLYKL
jgi:ankyrin repeat protein